MAYEAGASDQLAPMGDETDLPGMLSFDPDNFMDSDDLAQGMLPLDLDLEGLGTPSQQQYENASLDNMASQVQHSIEESGDALDGGNSQLEGPGAGPLPASYGVQLPPNAGSTLTEFTKRRNWSQRVIEELKDFLHVLTPDGRFLYASPSAQSVTGHDAGTLVGQFITDYIHPDDNAMFVREFNESIASGNPLRFYYRFRKPDGSYAIFECHGHPHLAADVSSYEQDATAVCRGFFMMSRPYPTKNAALLDSFLEHKIENERLKKRIADLKREEQEDIEEQQKQWQMRQLEGTNSTPVHASNDDMRVTANQSNSPSNFDGMPPPAKPSQSNVALTRQNLNEALAASRPDSINDKMARYEGVSHLETIEMLTGLRYRDGERSRGISTGAASPSLVRGDQGIAISVDRDRFGRGYSGSPYGDLSSDRDKKKKMKVADEYVCTDCGTLDSPEWRKGPTGPKTLCNACGLRWAKKEKKRSGDQQSQGKDAKGNGGNGQSGNGMGGSSIQTGQTQGPGAATSSAHGMLASGQPGSGGPVPQALASGVSSSMSAQQGPIHPNSMGALQGIQPALGARPP